MNIFVGFWVLPLLVAGLAWGWALLTPPEPTQGWVPDLKPILRGIAALIVTLMAFLIYFIVV